MYFIPWWKLIYKNERMKKMKKLIALLISVVMLLTASVGFALELGTAVTENIPVLSGTMIANTHSIGVGQLLAESDKYIFVGLSRDTSFLTNTAVQVWDKATGQLVTTLVQEPADTSWHCPVRDIYIQDDILYISWGNAVYSVGSTAKYAKDNSKGFSPLKAYDISNIDAETGIGNGLAIAGGNGRMGTDSPYNWGSISYFDKDNGKIYSSKVTSLASNKRTYTVMDATAVKEAVNAGSTANLTSCVFYTTGLSMNATQFMFKDGWLFEVLQNKAGISAYTQDTLKDAEGNVMNNTIYAYDLRNVELTSTSQDVTGYLRGIYTTQTSGTKAIRDIEVIGDYMYVATLSADSSSNVTDGGIEVVSLESAKAEEVTTALTLTAETVLEGEGGAMDLEAVGTKLFAGFSGPQLYKSPNVNYSDPGEIVVYEAASGGKNLKVVSKKNIAYGASDISVNMSEGIIYILNDTQGPPAMTALSFEKIAPEFEKGFILGEQITENVPYLTSINGDDENTPITGSAYPSANGQLVAENDNYIFVVSAKGDFNSTAIVRIYSKENGELITSLAEGTKDARYWRSVRSLYVLDDVLYVTWGTAWIGGVNGYVDADGVIMSPTKVYDVSNLTEGAQPTSLRIQTSGQRVEKFAPYIGGNISYLDKENGKLYISSVENNTINEYRTYFIYDTDDIKAALLAGSTSGLSAKKFSTGELSMNTVKFIVKDGWLYELLKSKAGLYAHTVAETLVDDEGNALNNMVRVYDISGKTPTTSSIDSYEDCLRGIYETETEGQDVLRDMEVYGDTLYVSNAQGVDVVPLSAAKKAGVTAETKATLTKSTTLTGAGGANGLELKGSYLTAAFEGAERFGQPNHNPGYGEVIVYNVGEAQNGSVVVGSQSVQYGAYDVALSEDDGVMYVLNDTSGPPSMKAYSFTMPSITLTEDGTVAYTVKPGIYDITVKLTNTDSVSGTIICAAYEENRLAGIAPLKTGAFAGSVTVAEGFEITENITKLKIMYFSDANSIIKPLCQEIYVSK